MSTAPDAPQDPRALVRRRRLAVAAAITLAATAWTALQPDDPPPASKQQRQRRDAALSPTRAPAPGSAATATPTTTTPPTASARASATTSPWPDAPRIDHRQPWPAGIAQGVAGWTATPPPQPPAPPPVRTAAVAAQPQAPAFPYVLIGRLDDGEPRALLSGPLRSFGVKPADVIDGQWRVDSVAAQGLTLTWLPGSLKKTLTFGAS